tara:strand:+ start:2856 stop:3038 length:183 start_codon:yes stop_codon:yes gene_type:complete
MQRDIQRYAYCTKTGVPPYSGSYGDQPALWVEKFFIIKNAFAKKERKQIDGKRQSNNSKV